MYEGFLEFGGGEVLNSARAKGYTSTAPCPVNWLVCPPCDGIRDYLGDDPYTYETIFDAPWYDAEDEVTHRFLGAHAISVEGIPDSTREASVAEAMLDGGVVGRVRHATRRMRYRAVLTALGEDALEAGFSWLSSALAPGSCGTHGDGCGAADTQFFTACPPERADVTMPETFWNDPITNLATNPSMESVGNLQAIRTNLATNPSFEATTAATVEVRRNLQPNPSFEVATSGWSGFTATITRVTTEFHNGVASAQVVTGGVAAAEGLSSAVTVASMAGKSYSSGAWVKAPVGARLGIRTRTTGALAQDSAIVAFVGTGAWQWVQTGLKVAQADATILETQVRTSDTQAITFYVDGVIMMEGQVTEFFDGATPAAGDFSYAWTGTANASASVQYGIAPVGVNTNNAERARRVQSTEWAASGTKSVRIVPITYDSYAEVGPFPLTTGKTYTVLATVRVPATLTGTLNPNALGMTSNGAPTGTFVLNEVAQNVPGVYRVRATLTTISTGNWSVRLWNGAPAGGGEVWWDDLLMVEGIYTGPYFDGSTPAKVRRNFSSDPAATSLTSAVLGSGKIGINNTRGPAGSLYSLITGASDGPLGLSTYARKTYPVVTGWDSTGWSLTGVITGATTQAGTGLPVSPGEVLTVSVYVRHNSATSKRLKVKHWFHNAAGTRLSAIEPDLGETPPNQWVRLSGTVTVPDGAAFYSPLVEPHAGSVNWGPDERFDISAVLVERSATLGDYFDGSNPVVGYGNSWEGTPNNSLSYLYDGDFTYAWSGTPNASTSLQRARDVSNYDWTDDSRVFTSGVWSASRTLSLRISPVTTSNDSYAFAEGLGLTPGKTYTASAVVHLNAAQAGALAEYARSIAVLTGSGGVNVVSDAAPNAAGDTRVSVTFTVLDSGYTIRLYNGASGGKGEVWWDDFMVVEGEYGGSYFDGTFPDSPPEDHEVVGKNVVKYDWTGTPDASTSTYTTGTVVAVPDPVEYERILDSMTRNLHTVTCVSGPIVERKLHRGDTWGYIVEFVLVAAVPWMFSVTKPVILQPSIPVVVQDVPFNLVPYPSAELESGTVVAATNFVTNPSVESAITGWVVAVDAAKILAPQVAIAQSNELASTGAQSAKVVFTANTTNTAGWFAAQQEIALPGITATTRYSVNLWAVASVQSGTAVIGSIEYEAVWMNASSTVLRTDTIGTNPGSGGAKSMKSILPPAGTTKVTIRARLNVTSWSTGAIIRLYADSAAVTVP